MACKKILMPIQQNKDVQQIRTPKPQTRHLYLNNKIPQIKGTTATK